MSWEREGEKTSLLDIELLAWCGNPCLIGVKVDLLIPADRYMLYVCILNRNRKPQR